MTEPTTDPPPDPREHGWAMLSIRRGLYQTAVMPNGQQINLHEIYDAGYDEAAGYRPPGEG